MINHLLKMLEILEILEILFLILDIPLHRKEVITYKLKKQTNQVAISYLSEKLTSRLFSLALIGEKLHLTINSVSYNTYAAVLTRINYPELRLLNTHSITHHLLFY